MLCAFSEPVKVMVYNLETANTLYPHYTQNTQRIVGNALIPVDKRFIPGAGCKLLYHYFEFT